MNLLMLLLSLLCYIVAPKDYSYQFIIVLFVIFSIQSLLYIRNKRKEQLINFHTIFLITSFIVVYIYPLFIHPIGGTFIKNLSEDFINKGSALAQVCLSGYLFGISLIHTTKKTHIENQRIIPVKKILPYFYLIVIYGCVYYFSFIGEVYGSIEKDDTTSSIILLLFTILIVLNTNNTRDSIKNVKDLICKNKTILFPMMIYCSLLLLIGIRHAVLSVLLVSLMLYVTYSKRINYKLIISAGLFCLSIFFIVVVTRNGGNISDYNSNLDTSIPKIFYVLSDLIGISNNLYAGVEYVEQYGYINGASIIPQFFAPIPYLPTLLTELLYGTSTIELTTQYILSDFLGTVTTEHTYFVGTNCFVDIYMNCGLLITMIVFIALGFVIQKITINRHTNVYFQFAYFIIVSNAIFMVRGTIYSCYRPIIWGVIIIYFLSHLKSRQTI